MRNDIKEIILDEKQICDKVKEMGALVSKDYAGCDLMLIGVLKGSVMFMAELMKNISIPCSMDFMAVSSYGSSTKTSGVVRILKDLDFDIEGKDILIVEDIVDTGVTLKFLIENLKARGPKSVEIASLLNKEERRRTKISAKYTGFNVPDLFLVGYGLDYAEKYRNLPYIGVLKEEIYK